MGTLAITDEEKKRLEELLEDFCEDNELRIGDTTSDSTSSSSVTPYKIDEEADELLKNLTEQLTVGY